MNGQYFLPARYDGQRPAKVLTTRCQPFEVAFEEMSVYSPIQFQNWSFRPTTASGNQLLYRNSTVA